jgi:SAM-dependent methyltransferase
MTRYDPHGDTCLSIWAHAYGSGGFDFPPAARVLEIGCAEADWQTPMLAVRPDLQITGIDWRACRRPGTTIRGDVLAHAFPPASFDVVVGISSIEHIGLGHYEQDPAAVEGDVQCLARVRDWLRPGGWVYLDVPYNAAGYHVLGTKARIYDDAAIAARLIPPGLREAQRWYVDRSGTPVGVPAPRELPGFDYVALRIETV